MNFCKITNNSFKDMKPVLILNSYLSANHEIFNLKKKILMSGSIKPF